MFDDDLVERVCKLGLTRKQARVYASVLTSKANSIGEISKRTAVHDQDIYKILKSLEKAGLVTKTIDKPIRVEAIPVEKALGNLIEHQLKIVEEQKRTAQEITQLLRTRVEVDHQEDNGTFSILPRKSEALKNRGAIRIGNTKSTYDLFVARQICRGGVPGLVHSFSSYPFGVKVRVLISTTKEDTELKKVYREENWPSNASPLNITVKKTCEQKMVYYAIFDNEEVWIPLELSSPSSMLVTNSKAVIRITQENFDRVWEDKKTITLLEKKI
jgi:sugar-specific transcriptional regulator TrmB